MAEKRRENVPRRTFVSAMVVLTGIMLAIPAAALALPSETPDNTLMIDGRVRAIEQVGNNLWLGGNFDQVESATAQFWNNVGDLAVLQRPDGRVSGHRA